MLVSLEISGKNVVIIGSGGEALSRAKQFIRDGANVTLICGPIIDVGSAEGVRVIKRSTRGRDLKGAFLVVATDRDVALNRWLDRKATKYGYLLNTLDEKATCSFYHVAVRHIEPSIDIAVSTNGASPAFASRVATRLAAEFSDTDRAVFEAFVSTRNYLKSNSLSTFEFDWDALEKQVRSGIRCSQTFQESSSDVGTFAVSFANGVSPSDETSWPSTPFTNNLIDLRANGSKRLVATKFENRYKEVLTSGE